MMIRNALKKGGFTNAEMMFTKGKYGHELPFSSIHIKR